MPPSDHVTTSVFQSTPSARRATDALVGAGYRLDVSIHALRTEGDVYSEWDGLSDDEFQSTPSARRATSTETAGAWSSHSFNPRPPHGGRLTGIATHLHRGCFNPRPPHGGRPVSVQPCCHVGDGFNPRPPHGGRLGLLFILTGCSTFQSTPSARRATRDRAERFCEFEVSIHALRTEGDRGLVQTDLDYKVSIHALRTEGDRHCPRFGCRKKVSIHALRTEGDVIQIYQFPDAKFQSTPSARRATPKMPLRGLARHVSIHALRTEGDHGAN